MNQKESPFLFYWNRKPLSSEYEVLPGENCVIGIQTQGSIYLVQNGRKMKLDSAGITGILTSSRTFFSKEGVDSFLIQIPPYELATFLKEPLKEITGRSICLEDLFSERSISEFKADCIEERGKNLPSGWAWSRFYKNLKKRKESNPYIEHVLSIMNAAEGKVSISSLCKEFGISQSKMERDFKTYIGLSPKEYSDLIRFRKSVSIKDDSKNLTDLAYVSGYYDQSHFIREFKKRTGKTPKQWFK
ncbi:helix-turn-helix domain-containing protein [Leptospira stimsonii]|uniref:AraC family transcriptional regulator n=1 Tax=Leptospira stimsonii TaxID=2202203 RepID=A0ABY2N942_9LEPT|nr:helix-turn-helix domain-containing protein [Leptospira stimsonii]TGK11044.1 AraC family transcriptional regulator [Leptospira stimsonii]TGM18835.1 AraC family transcriptional regulator [Leptospira stimsonii]